MLRHLFTIIKNNLRSNLLLIVGVFIIGSSLWYALDYIYIQTKNMLQPIGFDWRNVYYVGVGVLPQESNEYDATPRSIDETSAEYLDFKARLLGHPAVESACYTNLHFHYMWKNRNMALFKDTLGLNVYQRIVDPDYFMVFKVKGADGCSPEVLTRMAKSGEGCILTEDAARYFVTGKKWIEKSEHGASELVGKFVCTDHNGGDSLRVLGVCERQKYNEFNFYNPAVYDLNPKITVGYAHIPYYDMFIRVKPGSDGAEFMENFRREMNNRLRIGNLYLADMRPMSEQRKIQLAEYRNELYSCYAIAGFFLMNAFLAILGTFWFRTQQRTDELAIRLTFGATPVGLMKLLMLEGVLLITVSFVGAMTVGYCLGVYELVTRSWEWDTSRFLMSSLLTYLCLLVITLLSIYFPARKAMNIQVVEALHGE